MKKDNVIYNEKDLQLGTEYIFPQIGVRLRRERAFHPKLLKDPLYMEEMQAVLEEMCIRDRVQTVQVVRTSSVKKCTFYGQGWTIGSMPTKPRTLRPPGRAMLCTAPETPKSVSYTHLPARAGFAAGAGGRAGGGAGAVRPLVAAVRCMVRKGRAVR